MAGFCHVEAFGVYSVANKYVKAEPSDPVMLNGKVILLNGYKVRQG
jgi:hypothetical protein